MLQKAYKLNIYNSDYFMWIDAGILHKNIIDKFVKIYKEYLDKLLDTNNIWTDQVILTHMFKDNTSLFYELTSGYGNVVPYI